jgi:hypothetical protein
LFSAKQILLTIKPLIMKPERNVQAVAYATMQRIQSDYTELLSSSSKFSLQKLFTPEQLKWEEFCKEFYPHPQSDELKKIVQYFGQDFGIWLPNAKQHITCALFLYPTAHFDRMLTMMKNLVIGFYLNDVMGRDTFRLLDSERQKESRIMIRSMAGLNEDLYVSSHANRIEWANAEILRQFRESSPQSWFRKFLRLYCHHIGITHTDGNVEAQGRIPGVLEYMERRCHLGGVHHIMHWIEYSDEKFLDWDMLKTSRLSRDLKRLHWVTAAFAGMSNDLFSFEKEVIDCGADSNLVMIIALNKPGISLKEAIRRAADIVRNLLVELLSLLDSVRSEIGELVNSHAEMAQRLTTHLSGVVRCVQAIWTWHCYSKRYKRPRSIWKETILVEEAMAV